MGKIVGLNGNYAIAYAVKAVGPDVIAAYPITPQTAIVEKLAEFIAQGELDAEYIHVESEHSAMSAIVGAAATGARVFTATSSQGLGLMYEILFIASSLRLPAVMGLVTRAYSAPINIWCDHGDFMSAADTGWIQYMSTSNQEAYDAVIMAYKISEDPRVLLPTMVSIDGFIQSHTIEPVKLEDEEEIKKFVPRRPREIKLDPDKPMTLGALGDPNWYYEFKMQQQVAMEESRKVFDEVTKEFTKKFGRSYGAVDSFMTEDAEAIIVTMGSTAGTFRVAIEKIRKEGAKVGLVTIKLYRPFPRDDIVKILSNAKVVGIAERDLFFGAAYPGYLFNDVATSLYLADIRTKLAGFIFGLGGRALRFSEAYDIVRKVWSFAKEEIEVPKKPIFVGVRE